MINQRKRNGFTLIELLVYVAIIGLIAIAAWIAVDKIRARSRDTRRVADITSIQEALAMYQTSYQVYPIYEGYITGSDPLSSVLISEGVMRVVPADPINGLTTSGVISKYYYKSTRGNTYLIKYYLETDTMKGKTKGVNTVYP